MNKTLAFLGIILLFVLLAGGVYFFVLRGTPAPTENQNPVFGPGGVPVDRGTPSEEDDFSLDNSPVTTSNLTQIHTSPVAGVTIRTKESDILVGSSTQQVKTTSVEYVDKQTGHIFAFDPETGSAERISNTTFPGIQEVLWPAASTSIVLRYVNGEGEVETFLGEVENESLTGSYIDTDLSSAQTFGDSVAVASVTDRGTDIIVSDVNGGNSQTLFETPLSDIVINAYESSFLSFFTRPAQSLRGALYFYEGNTLKRVLGGRSGLTALPNKEGTFILFSQSTNNSFETSLLDRETGEIRNLPIATLPEKCVWDTETRAYCMVPEGIPSGEYPDAWYRGQVSFTDTLWAINVTTGTIRSVTFFDEQGPFDGTDLAIDEDGFYLSFINKKDGTLWGFAL